MKKMKAYIVNKRILKVITQEEIVFTIMIYKLTENV